MATVVYTRTAYNVDTVEYDGTNADEITTLVGAQHVSYRWDSACAINRLVVRGHDIAIGELVAKTAVTGELVPRITPGQRDTDYVPV